MHKGLIFSIYLLQGEPRVQWYSICMRILHLEGRIPPGFLTDSSLGLVVRLNLPPTSLEPTAVGNPCYLKTSTSKAPSLMALCFSPLQGLMLAEACNIYKLFRNVLKSHTALVWQMPVSTLLDLSTALNKHHLKTADIFLHF